MKKEFFQKLAWELAIRYDKDELAKLLIKNKDRRISNLIASAYNKKLAQAVSRKYGFIQNSDDHDWEELQSIEGFYYKKRVIGPGSWIYEILQNGLPEEQKSWNKYLNKIKYVSLKDKGTLDRIFEEFCREALENY